MVRIVNNPQVDKPDILHTECLILTKLEFSVTYPSGFRLLERFCRLAQFNQKQNYLAWYLSDTSMLDCSLVKELPSRVAACCVYAVMQVYSKVKPTTE